MPPVSSTTFGVEIECGHDEFDEDDTADLFCEAGFSGYGFVDDGSGVEIQTPVLKGEKGYRELARAMDFLRDKGFWVSRKDGMHVHIGASFLEDDEEACTRLLRSFYNNQAYIGAMCSAHRSGRYSCPRITRTDISKVGKESQAKNPGPYVRLYWKGKEWGNRKAINLQNVPTSGTVEFRLHEGCLDPRKAISWVQFCQKFVDYAEKERKPLACARSKVALLEQIHVPADAIPILSKRQPMMPLRAVR